MKSLNKIWVVVSNINEVRQIAPKSKPCTLVASTFNGIENQEVISIFEKLANDDKVITLVSLPDRARPNSNNYVFEVLPSFSNYFEDFYAHYSIGIDKLNGLNLLKIFDIALDIHDELNLTSQRDVKIMLAPQVVRFRQLRPDQFIPALERYCDYRLKSCEFLQEMGVISAFSILNANAITWKRAISVELVSRIEFDRAFKKLQDRYNAFKTNALPSLEQPTYDAEASLLSCGKKSIRISDGSLQHSICKFVFKDFGQKIPISEVIDDFGKEAKTRSVSDARRRLNERVLKTFGIQDLFGFSNEKVFINSSQFINK